MSTAHAHPHVSLFYEFKTNTETRSGLDLVVRATAWGTWEEHVSDFGKRHCEGIKVSNMEFFIFQLREIEKVDRFS